MGSVIMFQLLQFRKHPTDGRIRILDVGSCYNPFKGCDKFCVVALDLYPAVEVNLNNFRNYQIKHILILIFGADSPFCNVTFSN